MRVFFEFTHSCLEGYMLKRWKKIKFILTVSLSALLLYSGVNIGIYIYDGHAGKEFNENLQKTYHQFDGGNACGDTAAADKPDAAAGIPEQYADRFKSLLDINKDVVGWIHIPGTRIDYPVVQGEDNRFYLNHSLRNERSSRGAIFMDYRNHNDDKDYNTVLYGHHMKDGGMFGGLSAYKDYSYYPDHANIEYDSLAQPAEWRIFSVYVCRPGDDALQITFNNDEEYARYLDKIINRSIYKTGVAVTKDDRILTLMTCSYEYDNAKLVIHAKIELKS